MARSVRNPSLEIRMNFRPYWSVAALVFALNCFFAHKIVAQNIDVDVTHETNRFVPDQTLGAGIDRIPVAAIDKDLVPSILDKVFTAGWGPVTFRQNTELFVQAWHWNPNGTWSDAAGKGYFVGDAVASKDMIRHSFGYSLPHRGVTRNSGSEFDGYSRLDDGDLNTYWKSNPYLTRTFTEEEDSAHPQWIAIKLAERQIVTAIRIAWAEPYARNYKVQYWLGNGDAIDDPENGEWKDFPAGTISDGKGGTVTLQLSPVPVAAKFVRVLMTESS